MNLIVDIGNTRTKLAVMEGGKVVAQRSVERLYAGVIDELIVDYPTVCQAIVCSTRDDGQAVAELIRLKGCRCVVFTPQMSVPLANAYRTPKTLGRDRLAAAVGAALLYPSRNVLIVDFGTALTLDLVSADATYRGGFISPGVQTRFRALHDYTAKLPLCSASNEILPLGVTTQTSIVQGVMCGVTYEIEGHIARMSAEYGDLCIIFTGGEAKYFVERIKNTIFADWNLIFCGLNRILEYNASEKNLD
ncbi:MAG: type III pantothenate kinase [Alistipes sp.]